MAKNRELSQVGSLVTVNDSSGQVGVANSVGINTTTPQGNYALYVQGDANITGNINTNGVPVAVQADIVALAIALGQYTMANTFKLKTKANVGISTQNVYVVPSATTTVVIGITLANTSGSGCLVGVGITRPSTDDIKILKNAPIPQGSSLEFMQGNKVVLEALDTITVNSDTNNLSLIHI